MLSRAAEYAIAALSYLAEQPPGELCGADEIATATDTPLPYLRKVLGELADSRLIRSFKGKAGGYQLGRASSRITIGDILSALSEEAALERCLLTHSDCDKKHLCVLHEPWTSFCKQVNTTTLADLLTKSRSKTTR